MSTNDRKIIRTEHVPTGRMVDFYLSQDASPGVVHKIRRRDQLLQKTEELRDGRTREELSEKEAEKLAGLYGQHNELSIKIFASILDPVDGVPEDYDNKLDFVADCAKSNYVIDRVIDFFYTFLPSSMPSQGDKEYQAYKERLEQQVQVVDSQDTSPSS